MLEENRQEPVLPEDRKRTFEAQALWKRVIIVLAGPAMNVLFPVLLYFAVFVGETRFSPPTVGVVLPGHPAEGKLQPGRPRPRGRRRARRHLRRAPPDHRRKSPNKELKLKVFRDNEHVEVAVIPEEKIVRKPLEIVERVGEIGIEPSRPAAVIGISRPDSPAYRAGLRTFDRRHRGARAAGEDVRRPGVGAPRQPRRDGARHLPAAGAVSARARRPRRPRGLRVGRRRAHARRSAHGDLPRRAPASSPPTSTWPTCPRARPSAKAELRPGDRIVEVDHVEVPAWSTFLERLCAAPDQPARDHLAARRASARAAPSSCAARTGSTSTAQHRPRFRAPRLELGAARRRALRREPRRASATRFRSAVEETYDVDALHRRRHRAHRRGQGQPVDAGRPDHHLRRRRRGGRRRASPTSSGRWRSSPSTSDSSTCCPSRCSTAGTCCSSASRRSCASRLPLRVREVASLAGLSACSSR